MGKLILVTGGARSGKSTYAENLAKSIGDRVMYIATSIPFDDEMKDRVKKHRERRPASWDTFEGYKDLKKVFHEKSQPFQIILLDCITIMITNLMFDFGGFDVENSDEMVINQIETKILQEINEFLDEAILNTETTILVTNEVGFGIVPDNKLARIFRDLAGRANQYIASRSDEVYLLVCGLPIKIK
ncbi:MAG TPA: bifunctional adenosylcobinamide kinase/adenosylcobinamide-phosphate guanylyltransferase [Ruminiclostridium sp.]